MNKVVPSTLNPKTGAFDFLSIIQIGIIVPDAEAAARNLTRLLGWKAGNTWETSRVSGRTYRGIPTDFACRMIFFQLPGMELEIIQPLLGPSCWQDYLDSCGSGIHHLLFDVADSAQAFATLHRHTIEIEQQGRALPFGEQVFWAYVDSQPTLGFTMELTNRREFPKKLPPAPIVEGVFAHPLGVSIVVQNLEQTICRWEDILGWTPEGEPYRIYGDSYQCANSSSLSGAASYRLRNMQIELVRPVCGASSAREYRFKRGDGICSFNIALERRDDLLALTRAGIAILEEGHTLNQNALTRWAILDTLTELGFYLKVVYP